MEKPKLNIYCYNNIPNVLSNTQIDCIYINMIILCKYKIHKFIHVIAIFADKFKYLILTISYIPLYLLFT